MKKWKEKKTEKNEHKKWTKKWTKKSKQSLAGALIVVQSRFDHLSIITCV